MADIFLDTSVEAVEASSKFTRRRTVGPGVQKQKIKLCLPESSGIFQRPGGYRPEYKLLFNEHEKKY